MNLHQFLLILRARWKIALFTFAVIVLGTLAASLLSPAAYRATTTVVADVRAPDPVAGMMLGTIATPTYMPTQVDIINSERVAHKVVKMLHLDENAAVRDAWMKDSSGNGNLLVWLIDSLKTRLDVTPSRDSNVIAISYESPDPEFSAAVANGFAQAYINTTVEMKVEPARLSADWFFGQTRAAREALERAQARISEYQQQKGLVSPDERVDVETSKLNELSTQLTLAQALTVDAASKQRAAGRSAEVLPEVLQNTLVTNLKSELAGAEAKLVDFSSRYGSKHPDYQRLSGNVATIKTQLAAETARVTGSFGAVRGVGADKEAQLRAAIAAQKVKLLELKNQRAELGVLLREGETAQRAYDAVSQRYTQTSLESQATQTNVLVLTPATAPNRPSSPNLMLNMLIALGVGVLLALAAAFGREIGDRRIRSHEDLESTLQLPVLSRLSGPQRSLAMTRLLGPQRRQHAFSAALRAMRRLGGPRRLEGRS